MKNNDWKDRLNIVYSTNPDFKYEESESAGVDTKSPEKQQLRIKSDKKNRNGKTVTLVTGFVGSDDDLKVLEKLLKTKCGVGGSSKEGEVIIQGDFKQKILEILQKEGYIKSRVI